MEHTPGPWHHTPPHCDLHAVRAGPFAGIVADVGYSGTVERDIANARLIAAAPDMLAALQLWTSGALDLDCMEATRAAIAKATGEAE